MTEVEWWITLSLFFLCLVGIAALRVPVAIAFLAANAIFVSWLVGFDSGMRLLVTSMYDSLSKFSLSPVPMFILMGEILFRTGLGMRTINALNHILGRVPGRLGVLTMGSGTIFATLSGSQLANAALLGSVLVPEMQRRGYHPRISVGTVTAAGGIAILIPPSALLVLVGTIGQGMSVGALLLAGVVPGVLMAIFFVGYVVVACHRNPDLAPNYDIEVHPLADRIRLFVVNVLPLLAVVVVIIGTILAGFGTPTEAAALGAIAVTVLALAYRTATWSSMRAALVGSVKLNGMLLIIIATASGYSQMLAYSGAARSMVAALAELPVPSLMIVAILLLITIALGSFMDGIALMAIMLPLSVPVILALGFNPIWFGILFVIAIDIGSLTPPVGLLLYVMKGIVPPDITMTNIITATLPFVWREVVFLAVLLFFPQIVLWLPALAGH